MLVVNQSKPDVLASLGVVRQAISRAGGELVAEQRAEESPLPPECGNVRAEIIIVLGGDGTLLTQCRRCAHLGLPMLGINFGKLGFLAEFDLTSFQDQALQLFDGRPLTMVDRPLLRVALSRAGSDPHRQAEYQLALNEAAIVAGPPYRMIRMTLAIDGHAGPSISGDGMIVCTPAGSTAYNVSAGGPILAPDVRAICITPIAAHTLAFRPVVVAGTSSLTLVMDRTNEPETSTGTDGASILPRTDGTTLMLDGRAAGKLHVGDTVHISLHDRPVRFVKNPHIGYWETLSNKMGWGASPRLRGNA